MIHFRVARAPFCEQRYKRPLGPGASSFTAQVRLAAAFFGYPASRFTFPTRTYTGWGEARCLAAAT